MNVVNIITLALSAGTLCMIIINSYRDSYIKRKDRMITVKLSEKRRMQNELFNHITSILDIGRRSYEITDEYERQKMKFKILNHKIFIWINLNSENKYSFDLRKNCNEYCFWIAGSLGNSENNFDEFGTKNQQSIWKLIDKYIEEENRLIEDLI